jgi:hypothetical protein
VTKSRSELDPLIVAQGRGAMTARRKKAAPHAEASEATIYLDRDVAGTVIVERKGRVTATDAAGKRLGVYRTDREAMAAILAAARAVRETAR